MAPASNTLSSKCTAATSSINERISSGAKTIADLVLQGRVEPASPFTLLALGRSMREATGRAFIVRSEKNVGVRTAKTKTGLLLDNVALETACHNLYELDQPVMQDTDTGVEANSCSVIDRLDTYLGRGFRLFGLDNQDEGIAVWFLKRVLDRSPPSSRASKPPHISSALYAFVGEAVITLLAVHIVCLVFRPNSVLEIQVKVHVLTANGSLAEIFVDELLSGTSSMDPIHIRARTVVGKMYMVQTYDGKDGVFGSLAEHFLAQVDRLWPREDSNSEQTSSPGSFEVDSYQEEPSSGDEDKQSAAVVSPSPGGESLLAASAPAFSNMTTAIPDGRVWYAKHGAPARDLDAAQQLDEEDAQAIVARAASRRDHDEESYAPSVDSDERSDGSMDTSEAEARETDDEDSAGSSVDGDAGTDDNGDGDSPNCPPGDRHRHIRPLSNHVPTSATVNRSATVAAQDACPADAASDTTSSPSSPQYGIRTLQPRASCAPPATVNNPIQGSPRATARARSLPRATALDGNPSGDSAAPAMTPEQRDREPLFLPSSGGSESASNEQEEVGNWSGDSLYAPPSEGGPAPSAQAVVGGTTSAIESSDSGAAGPVMAGTSGVVTTDSPVEDPIPQQPTGDVHRTSFRWTPRSLRALASEPSAFFQWSSHDGAAATDALTDHATGSIPARRAPSETSDQRTLSLQPRALLPTISTLGETGSVASFPVRQVAGVDAKPTPALLPSPLPPNAPSGMTRLVTSPRPGTSRLSSRSRRRVTSDENRSPSIQLLSTPPRALVRDETSMTNSSPGVEVMPAPRGISARVAATTPSRSPSVEVLSPPRRISARDVRVPSPPALWRRGSVCTPPETPPPPKRQKHSRDGPAQKVQSVKKEEQPSKKEEGEVLLKKEEGELLLKKEESPRQHEAVVKKEELTPKLPSPPSRMVISPVALSSRSPLGDATATLNAAGGTFSSSLASTHTNVNASSPSMQGVSDPEERRESERDYYGTSFWEVSQRRDFCM